MDLLAFAFPRRCAVCDLPGEELCGSCRGALVRLGPTGCARCGAPGPWPVSRCAECSGRRLAFAVARAAIAYDERARALVRAWKERGRRQLAPMLASLVTGAVGRPDVDALVWVPGDRERTRYRGHLPSRGLALALGVDWGLPAVGLLERSGGASRQAGLTLAARRHNVRGVFRARSRPPPRICLVDDVYTTGSTAHACAAAVRRAGGSYVEVVCLARAVR